MATSFLVEVESKAYPDVVGNLARLDITSQVRESESERHKDLRNEAKVGSQGT